MTHSMWEERAASLLEALNGTEVDPLSNTLLDDLIAVRHDHPKISAFIDGLPGLSSGNRDKAEEQLGYMTMQFSRLQRESMGEG